MKRTLLALALWFGLGGALLAFDTRPTPDLPGGKTIQLPLPAVEHMQNVGGSDGAGLCVYTSVTLAAKWQNIGEAYQLRKFAEGRPGGSYPEKLAADLKTYAGRYNVTLPNYVQHTGGDDAFLDLCMRTRRMPGITYAGADDFYDGPILHMVNLANLDEQHGTIQDNNRAGKWTTDSRRKILYRWKGLDDNGKDLLVPVRQGLRTIWVPAGGGWAFVWLSPPPPPRPAGTQAAPKPDEDRARCGHWSRETTNQDRHVWCYWVNGDLIGAFLDGKFYSARVQEFEFDGKVETRVILGDERLAPAGLSPPANEPTDDWNKGVESWRFDRRNRYWVNGVETSQIKAYAAVTDPGDLGDDSDKYHLSIVGASKKEALALFAPGGALEKYARRLHVQIYAQSDWPVKSGILTAAVTLQEPAKMGGRVVQTAAGMGAEAITKVLADTFDLPPPIKPDPPKPSPVPPAPAPAPHEPDPAKPVEPTLPGWLLWLGGLFLVLWMRKRV